MKKKYSKNELEKALIRVEMGQSYSEVCEGTLLNKSIIAREMRKRGNVKAQENIEESNERIFKEFLKMYVRNNK